MDRYDYGPLQTYEITWTSGHVETVQAHQVSWPAGGMALVPAGMLTGFAEDKNTPALVRFHGEIDGHWRLMLSAREEDIRTIRNVTAPEQVPAVGSDPGANR